MKNAIDIPKKIDPEWRKKSSWLNIKGISLDNCLNKTGEIEAGNTKISKLKSKIFTFGKYKGKLISEIENSDPKYVEWCEENVKNFNK